MTRKKILLIYLVLHAVCLLFAGGVLLVSTSPLLSLVFTCPFYRFLHLYCPVCGGTRAAKALLRLELSASLLYNPAVICLFLAVLYYEAMLLFYLVTGRKRVLSSIRLFPLVAVGLILLLYGILRNCLLVFFGIDPLGDLLPYWQ